MLKKALLFVTVATAGLGVPASSLAGQGLSVSDHHYDFGGTLVGTNSGNAEFVFTNTSNHSILVFSLAPVGPFGYGYVGCNNVTLAPGGTCQDNVYFSPPSAGNFRGSFEVDGSPTGAAKVGLAGTGIAP
jgi:hypothetical protein